jgi:hypothetical protein
MSTDIAKVIKGATKPKEAPPKDKYILAIKRYLQQPSPSSEVLFATVSQLLLPKLNSPSLVVSLKAHVIFHHLLSDRSLKKYALFALIAKYYASANRSSVDCTVGAGTSAPFMYFANPPAFPTPSLYGHNDSSGSQPQTPKHSQHSQHHTRLHKLRPSPSLSFFSTFSNRSDHYHQSGENSLEAFSSQSSKQQILPNLAHSLPQASGVNRLVSAYNRYLRERVLHYRQLQLDPITEKVHKCSIVDHENYVSHDFSNNLLSQIQCVIQQIRLLLACIFTNETLNHPLYYYCYNLVAKDLSILFRFLNIALVIALQNFFTLSTSNAERTLFAYKEYTQLQIPEEVLSYVRQAPNAVSAADLEIPQALRQDQKAITTLTKSLENYLYEISINEINDLAINPTASASTITTVAPLTLKTPPVLDTSNFLPEHKSSSPSTPAELSTPMPPARPDRERQFNNGNENNSPHVPYTDFTSKFDPLSSPQSRSHHTANSTLSTSIPDVPPPRVSKCASIASSLVTIEANNDVNLPPMPELPSTSDTPPDIPPKIDRRTFVPTFDPVASKPTNSRTTSSGTTVTTPASTHTAPEIANQQDPILELFEKANDPNIEMWKEIFEGLNNPEATFSLKFDLAAALQHSISLYEEHENQPQEQMKPNDQPQILQVHKPQSHQEQHQLEQLQPPNSAARDRLVPTFSYETQTNPYATVADYDDNESRMHSYPSNGGGAGAGGLGVYHAPPVPAYDDVSTINSATSSAASTYHSPNPQHPHTIGVLNDHDDYMAINGGYCSIATNSASSDHHRHHQNGTTDNPGNQKILGENLLKKKATGIMKKFKKVSI